MKAITEFRKCSHELRGNLFGDEGGRRIVECFSAKAIQKRRGRCTLSSRKQVEDVFLIGCLEMPNKIYQTHISTRSSVG